jgi:ABC-type nitrate/sulfonate/bicarbonate transport system substrate-binding protein
MTTSITPAPDSSYVDVFVPISFRRSGGRKTIVAPDGTLVAPERGKATDRTLIKALARAWRWQKLLDDGVYGSIAEMADKERINRSYLSRTIRLSLLAPDIVDAILNGTQPATLQLADLEAPFSIDWQEQRAAFGFTVARDA